MNPIPSPSQQERESALFELALEQAPANRAAFLLAVCGKDKDLLQRLEALLAAHNQFDGPGLDPLGRLRSTLKLDFEQPPDEAVGQTLGRYRLLERVGEGGFGVVYVAEQSEPVRRRVALKVIKLGMDTRQVVARFEAERQALAMMDHPNIAKVFDAGSTDKGRPYFVMELVRGIRITDYCDQFQLTTRERLDLFIQVCQAIQHAHQKGIIHRDLKPSNILVTSLDGVPVPKVIDFGIAKATEGRLTDKTVYTQLHQFIGTPAYVSPEQAGMSGLDIDTRSDIYSLGVLLYELLAGSTPFDPKELMAAGLDAMRQMICEKEPVRPSTRLATLAGEELTTRARRRSTEVPKLVHVLKGDLDWIVMKCLEKDRQRRYETANALAADINRHLSDEAVVARPPGALYKTQKFIRRNKLVFSVGLVIAAVLVLGITASLWQAARANRAALRALKAEAKAGERLAEVQAVSTFMNTVFTNPDPERNGRTITVAEMLDRAVTTLERDFADKPEIRVQLQSTLGQTYSALGLYQQASPLLEKVRDYCLTTFGIENTNTLNAMGSLAISYLWMGRVDDSVKLQTNVLYRRRKIHGLEHPGTVSSMHNLANSYFQANRKDEALKLREEVLALSRRVNGPEHPETLGAMLNLAHSYIDANRNADGLKLSEEVLPLSRKIHGDEHPSTLNAIDNLANTYFMVGLKDEALKLREETLPLSRKIRGPEHPITLRAMHNLALSYFDAGRKDEALKLREEVLQLRRKVTGSEHPETIESMCGLATSYLDSNRLEESIKLREEALSLSSRIRGPEHPGTLAIMHNLAKSYSDVGRNEEAINLSTEVLRMNRKVLGPGHPNTITTMNLLAWDLATSGNDTLRNGAKSVELAEGAVAATSRTNWDFLDTLAAAYAETEQFDKAAEAEHEAIRLVKSEPEKTACLSHLHLFLARKPYRQLKKP